MSFYISNAVPVSMSICVRIIRFFVTFRKAPWIEKAKRRRRGIFVEPGPKRVWASVRGGIGVCHARKRPPPDGG